MLKKKIYKYVLGIIIILLGIGIAVTQLPSKEKTILYTNDIIGVSFEYPKSYGDVDVSLTSGPNGEIFNGSFSDKKDVTFSLSTSWQFDAEEDLLFTEQIEKTYEEYPDYITDYSLENAKGYHIIGHPDIVRQLVPAPQTSYVFDHPSENIIGITVKANTETAPEHTIITETLQLFEATHELPKKPLIDKERL